MNRILRVPLSVMPSILEKMINKNELSFVHQNNKIISMTNLKPKKVSESKSIMTEMIMPNDTNPLGNLMGGNLLRWMDIVGGICAGRHCEALSLIHI